MGRRRRPPMRRRVMRRGGPRFSLFRQGVSAGPAMTDNDSAPLAAILGGAEMSLFDPPLTPIWAAYTTQLLLSLFDPPVERPCGGPGG
jgi:hypothetical protein